MADLEFEVLLEIPDGSIPVRSLDYTKSHTKRISAFSTDRMEYYFYFPDIGKYPVFPANVSREGKVIYHINKLTYFIPLSLSTLTPQDHLFFLIKTNFL